MYIYLYSLLIIGLIICLAFWYGRKTKEWKWSEYFFMAAGPILGMTLLTYFEGLKIVIFFFCSGLIGLVGEFILGLFCEKILGRRLWKYWRLSILGHTSLLSIPFWGGAGLVFLTLMKLLNL